MRCDNPIRLRNPYTNKNIVVGCRKCDSCRIAVANNKTLLLLNELKKNWMSLFITLTYDNKHLPVVFDGDNKVVRYDGNSIEVLAEFDGSFDFTPVKPLNYPVDGVTGVIYYRDFQLFINRFRQNYFRYAKSRIHCRFFTVCEYGTKRKRPHFHVILFIRREQFGQYIADLIVKSWKMCDSSVLRQGFEYADSAVSSYLAAYVNCNSRYYKLADSKFFKQKARRSAYSDYGITAKDKEELKRVIRHRLYNYNPSDDYRPFEYFDGTKIDRFSTCFISKRVFSTYFSKPFGFSGLSFNAFSIRTRIIYRIFHEFGGFSSLEKQSDKSFLRGYFRFLHLIGWSDHHSHFIHYVWLFWRMYALYQSSVLRNYMLTYEKKSKEDYFLDAYNTEYSGIGSLNFYSNLFDSYDVRHYRPYSFSTAVDLFKYKLDYGKRLIPKHRSNLYNLNF